MNLQRKQFIVLGTAIVIAFGLIIYAFIGGSKPQLVKGVEVKAMDLDGGVTVSGSVQAAHAVDLAFQTSGRVASVSADVGQKVTSGQVIATLDNSQANASFLQAQAALQTQELKLQDLTGNSTGAGTTGSDVQTTIQNNRQNLADKLTDGYVKVDASLSSYIDNLFYSQNINQPVFGDTVIQNGEQVTIASADSSYRLDDERTQVATLMKQWNALNQHLDTDAGISAASSKAEEAMAATQNLLTDLANVFKGFSTQDPNVQTVNTSFKSAIATSRTTVDAALSSLRTAEQASASASVSVSPYNIQLQQAAVASAEAQVAAINATLSGGVIRAPFTGVVTVQNAKVGQTAIPGSPVISLISNDSLQIEVYVSEADIGKIAVGMNASTTLDAFGTSKILDANVISIDPSETMNNGTGSYKVTLQFTNPDPTVKTGMTANVNFKTAHKTNVVAVPTQAIITKDNKTYVLIDNGNGTSAQHEVTTGIESSNGYVEITSGLNVGDHIMTFTN